MTRDVAEPSDMILYDCRAAHRGRRLNAAFLSLRDAQGIAQFKGDRTAFYDRYELTAEERSLIEAGDWDGLMRAGLSVYALGKARGAVEKDLLDIGAEIRGLAKSDFVDLLHKTHERK